MACMLDTECPSQSLWDSRRAVVSETMTLVPPCIQTASVTTLDLNIHSAPYRHVGPPSAWSVVPGVISLIVLG